MPLPPNQDHIDWSSPAVKQVADMMEISYPGGIAGYVKKAQHLLHPDNNDDDKDEEQNTENNSRLNLKLPAHQVHINADEPSPDDLALGNAIAGGETAFVLVAGGLGERLGAKSLKISLPVHTCGDIEPRAKSQFEDGGCFLHHYIAWISHCSAQTRQQQPQKKKPTMIIMTSDDTHARTTQLLERNNNFGNSVDIHLVKQTGVPCVSDINGTLSASEDGKSLIMKPHGHGDIHRLLLSSRLLPKLQNEHGVRYIVFMQDTNSGATTTLPLSLAVMEKQKWSMVFTCVPRLPGEAIGALVEANVRKSNMPSQQATRPATYCVEYNVLDEMLKKDGGNYPAGDSAASATNPYSVFPGTINTLLVRLSDYFETVTRTEGVIAEFINPKYATPNNSNKKKTTTFKSPARLETLMQDIALELDPAKCVVGAVIFDRRTYFPVKNALKDGIAKWEGSGIDPHNAAQGEAGYFLLKRLILSHFVNQEESVKTWPMRECLPSFKNFVGASSGASSSYDVLVEKKLPLNIFPIFLSTSALDYNSCAKQFRHQQCRDHIKISRRSSLLLLGEDIFVESLDLDGALVVVNNCNSSKDDDNNEEGLLREARKNKNVHRRIKIVLSLSRPVKNDGWRCVPVVDTMSAENNNSLLDERHLIRGFKLQELETLRVEVPEVVVARCTRRNDNDLEEGADDASGASCCVVRVSFVSETSDELRYEIEQQKQAHM